MKIIIDLVNRLFTASMRRRLKKILSLTDDLSVYTSVFNRLNAIDMHWPIKIEVADDLIKLHDDEKIELFIARKERLSRYRRGVQERLRLLEREYLLQRVQIDSGDTIVDVGANIGEVSYLLARSHACRIIAIEPENLEFRCLVRNLQPFDAKCINRALWSSERKLTFYSKNITGDSSLFETQDYSEKRVVDTTTLDSILDESGIKRIRLLKLEAEGAEPEILDGAGRWLPRIDYITADVGPERGLERESTAMAVIEKLRVRGFELLYIGSPRLVCLFGRSDLMRH